MSLRVLLIDDHVLFRLGLRGLLERRGISVVAAVGTGEEGLRAAQQQNPDVILLDLRLPDINGIDVLRQFHAVGLTMPVVMLTASHHDRDIVGALRAGAQGYLSKDTDPETLAANLRDSISGKSVVTIDFTPELINFVRQNNSTNSQHPNRCFGLTRRETEVLALLADGQSNKVIARNLGISDGTVKLHVKAVLRKLAVGSRVEAAVFAVERGLRCNESAAPLELTCQDPYH